MEDCPSESMLLRADRIQRKTRIRYESGIQSFSRSKFQVANHFWKLVFRYRTLLWKWSKLTTLTTNCFLSGLKLLVWYCWCLHLHLPQVHLKSLGFLEVFRQSRPFLRKSSLVFDDFLCWFLKILSIALVLMFTQSNLGKMKPILTCAYLSNGVSQPPPMIQGFYKEIFPQHNQK